MRSRNRFVERQAGEQDAKPKQCRDEGGGYDEDSGKVLSPADELGEFMLNLDLSDGLLLQT